jgi:hypothetical protein
VIISGGSRCNWRFFARHLTNSRENNQVRVAEVRGLTSDTVLEALREMDAVASGTRVKNFFYHANINPRYGEHLTEEQWELAADALERNLGLTGHARFVVEHEKDGRVHRHIVWSRIDPDTMKAVSDSFTARDHERTSRELEEAFGLEPVESVLTRDREKERPERRAKNWETFRGHRSGLDPEEIKAEITALWNAADSGSAFAAALADHGYVLCKGDRRDFCIVDPAGNEHSLARRIEGVRAAAVRARMADIDRDELPTVAEGRELASQFADDRNGDEAPPANPADTQPDAAASPPEPQEKQPGSGIDELIAGYAEDIVQAMEGEQAAAWSAEELRDFLLSGEPGDGNQNGRSRNIDDYAAPMAEAIREDGAIPTRDGLTWWQRAGYAIGEMLETATTWALERWNSFVELVSRDRNNDPDSPDMER